MSIFSRKSKHRKKQEHKKKHEKHSDRKVGKNKEERHEVIKEAKHENTQKIKHDEKDRPGHHKKKEKIKSHFFKIKLFPKTYEKWVENQLYLSGSKKTPAGFIHGIAIVSLVFAILAGLYFSSNIYVVVPSVFILLFAMFNFITILSVDRRGRFVDEILPDALLLLSANIRAGYIPSRALILSARREFGPLSVAVKLAGKEIMSGKSLSEGLGMIPRSIKSEDLKRTIEMIIQGIKGGGQLVPLIEETATDIRRRQAIKKEIKANTLMYAIFIAFAGCLGAPGLYALSGYLINTMAKLTPDQSMTSELYGKVSFMSPSGMSLSPEFLFQFSIGAILITTIFGGLILGLIGSGKEKDGLKFAPILSLIALLLFFGATFLINTMFATMLPG